MPLFANIPCDLPICSNGYIEDYGHAFMLLSKNPTILIMLILYVIGIAFYNGLSVAITRYATAVH